MNQKPVVDKFGREIVAGDYIIYGRTIGRSAELAIARVISSPIRIPAHTPDNSWDYDQFRMEIWGTETNWTNTIKLLSKASVLKYPHTTIVLEEQYIPQEIKDLYKNIGIKKV